MGCGAASKRTAAPWVHRCPGGRTYVTLQSSMGVTRANWAAVAVLLLTALVVSGFVVHGHDHGPQVGTHGHHDLPTYSGGHDQPIPTTHVEEATRIESSPCLACLHQQRQRGAESRAAALGGIAPDGSSLELEGGAQALAGSSRLPASRAPPSA